MLRVPGSINSKNNKVVEAVQLWPNNNRPTANSMLFDFYIKLAAKEFAFISKKQRQKVKEENYYFQNRFIKRTYNSSSAQEISWIELNILRGQGISDYRKVTIDLILAPYLVNIKKCDYNIAYDTITKWLDHRRRNKIN